MKNFFKNGNITKNFNKKNINLMDFFMIIIIDKIHNKYIQIFGKFLVKIKIVMINY